MQSNDASLLRQSSLHLCSMQCLPASKQISDSSSARAHFCCSYVSCLQFLLQAGRKLLSCSQTRMQHIKLDMPYHHTPGMFNFALACSSSKYNMHFSMHAGICRHDQCTLSNTVFQNDVKLCKILFASSVAGMKDIGLVPPECPAPFNLWMNVPMTSAQDGGKLHFAPPVSKAGDYVTMRAEMDCVMCFSACPQDMLPINGTLAKALLDPSERATIYDAHYEVLPESAFPADLFPVPKSKYFLQG